MHDEKPTAEHRLAVCEGLLRKAEAEVARLRELAEHRGKSLVKQTRAHKATKARERQNLEDARELDGKYLEQFRLARVAEDRVAELQSEVARLRDMLGERTNTAHVALEQLSAERAAHEATKAERDEALQYVAELEASHGHAEARIKELEGTVLCNQQAADREYVRREAAEARVTELERKNDGLGRAKDVFASRAYKAEALVAELERDMGAINNEWHAETMRKLKAERAIDQARELLGRAHQFGISHPAIRKDVGAWLAAHPAPATPAAQPAETEACDGPEYPDGLTADGFAGGDTRFAVHHPEEVEIGLLPCLSGSCPEHATPAAARDARLQAQGFEPVSEEQREQNRLVNLGQATPAATGAEAVIDLAEALRESLRARKERET